MTKRAKVSVVAGVKINERELAVLRRVAEARPGVMSVRRMAEELSCSANTVRGAIRSLERKGLIGVEPRFLSNGGQLENEYEITCDGEHVLLCDDELVEDEG